MEPPSPGKGPFSQTARFFKQQLPAIFSPNPGVESKSSLASKAGLNRKKKLKKIEYKSFFFLEERSGVAFFRFWGVSPQPNWVCAFPAFFSVTSQSSLAFGRTHPPAAFFPRGRCFEGWLCVTRETVYILKHSVGWGRILSRACPMIKVQGA